MGGWSAATKDLSPGLTYLSYLQTHWTTTLMRGCARANKP